MHGFGLGLGGIFSLISMLFPLFIIGLVVCMLSNLLRGGGRKSSVKKTDDDPVTILKRRYARGEIDQDDYIQRIVDIEDKQLN